LHLVGNFYEKIFIYSRGKVNWKFVILHKYDICKLQAILLIVIKSRKPSCARHRGWVVEKRKAYTMFVWNTSTCCTERDKGGKTF